MSTFKIRLVTGPNQDTFYQRVQAPRESYVDIDKNNRVTLKHGNYKWKCYLSASDPSYINEKKNLISGLVFESRESAEKFINKHQKSLKKLASENPTFKRYEVFTITKRFMPEKEKLNYWKIK